jgi:PII-like signaling protein
MIPADARLLRLYINGSRRWQGKPLYRVVVETARTLHLAGASVFLVDLSYGQRGRLRDAKSEYTSIDIPVVVEVVDAPARIEELLDRIRPMVADGFATVEPVRVVRYAHHADDREPDAGESVRERR